MSELRYRTGLSTADLAAQRAMLERGECTITRSTDGESWILWFCFQRTTDGKNETRHIPVALSRDPGIAWGLHLVAPGRWQIAPSIQCLERIPDPNDSTKDIDVETWHETPVIVGVPADEPWGLTK